MANEVTRPNAKEVATLAAMIFAAEVQSRGGIMLGSAGEGERKQAVSAAIDLLRKVDDQLGRSGCS
jgi:hypothetical protein